MNPLNDITALASITMPYTFGEIIFWEKRGRKNRSNACKQGEQVGRVDKKCGISGGGKKAGKCKNICTPGRSPSLLPSHCHLNLFGMY